MNEIKITNKERLEILKNMKKYYLKTYVEDPIDGTNFDCDILDSFNLLIEKYEKKRIKYTEFTRFEIIDI